MQGLTLKAKYAIKSIYLLFTFTYKAW
jgi:hypothetical protein